MVLVFLLIDALMAVLIVGAIHTITYFNKE